MPNSKQRITARRHKKRKERIRKNRNKEMMNAKVGTLRKLREMGSLPECVRKERLPNG
jgi:hypothetical protein